MSTERPVRSHPGCRCADCNYVRHAHALVVGWSILIAVLGLALVVSL